MCQHDQTFQTENEANGGAGCPRCKQAATRWSTDEERAAWKAESETYGAQLAEAQVSVFEAEMRRLCADYNIEAPDYPGMWM